MNPLLCALVLHLSPVPAVDNPPIPEDTEMHTTESGLVYSVLQPGQGGSSPERGDRVRVHYTGWLTDGTMFDSSRVRGRPSEFGVGQVIEGWNEALALMTPGARYKLTIPHELAYGETGRPPTIPPRATLVFDVELLEVVAESPDAPAFDPEGAETTESGLQYRILEEGTGEACKPATRAWLEYAMWDEQGKLWMSSVMSAQPMLGPVGELPIPCLKEAAQMLRPGGHLVMRVPPELAFGDQGRAGLPAPNSTTLWDLRMVETLEQPSLTLPDESELQTTDSGLAYKILREGSGRTPADASTQVLVHYSGWLRDGTRFDSSYERGQPLEFRLDGVIAGWTEGMMHVREGGRILLLVPSELGYGDRGNPPDIPPASDLVFVVDLIRIGS